MALRELGVESVVTNISSLMKLIPFAVPSARAGCVL